MTLPAYLPPMVASQSQISASTGTTDRRADAFAKIQIEARDPALSQGGADASRPVQQPGEGQAVATASTGNGKPPPPPPPPSEDGTSGEAGIIGTSAASATERQAIALQQLSEIRARTDSADPLDLPVPVTQILQIVLAGGNTDTVTANADVGVLYEDVQQMIASGDTAEAPLAA